MRKIIENYQARGAKVVAILLLAIALSPLAFVIVWSNIITYEAGANNGPRTVGSIIVWIATITTAIGLFRKKVWALLLLIFLALTSIGWIAASLLPKIF